MPGPFTQLSLSRLLKMMGDKMRKPRSGIKCKFCGKPMRDAWHWENHSCEGRIEASAAEARRILRDMINGKGRVV